MSSGQKQSIELRLHAVEGLPAAGTIIKAEVHLGNGVKWASAAAISHGSTAYLGAWVAVQPAGAELLLRVHDRDVRSLTHCSSGTVSAHAVLPLPTLALGAAADGAAAEQAPDEQGWRHVSLAMQEGRAARLAHAVEQSLGEAARREDLWQSAQHPEDSRPGDADVEAGAAAAPPARRSRRGTGGVAAPAAQPQSREEGRQRQQAVPQESERQREAAHGEQSAGQVQQSLRTSETAEAARGPEAGHVAIEMPAMAGRQPARGGEEGQQAPAEAAEGGQGPPRHSDSLPPLRCEALTLHLSYRPLQLPPSSLLSAEHAAAAARSLAATRSLAPARTFIRLLSWKAPVDAAGGPARDSDDDEERQQRGAGGAEEARFRRWLPGVPSAARGGDELPDALQEGRLLELPLAPLPLHLHSYGHGAFMGAALSLLGDRRWQGLLRREDPQAFASAKRLAASLKLLASSRRKQGVARLHLAMMPCLENNPVLAAYGAVRSGSTAQLQPGEAPPLDGDSAAAALQAAGDDLRAAAAAVAPDAAAAAEVLADPVAPAGEPGDADPTVAPAQQEMAAGGGGECGAEAGAHAEGQEGAQGPQESRLVAGLRRRGHPAAADKIQRYLQSVLLPNRYGYRPIAQEWDIWVDPELPEDVRAAGISHGSARQLVTQAVATAVPCTRSCARSAGQTLIRAQGKSPVDWLNAFGAAVNAAVQGSRGVPLPLAGAPAACLRLRLTLHAVHGVPTGAWERPYLKAKLASSVVRVPKCRTGRGKAQGAASFCWSKQESGGRPRWLWPAPGGGSNGGGGASQQGAALSFWPLLPGFEGGDTVDLELHGDPAGLLADTQVGRALLPLAELSRRCPQLLDGEEVRLEVPLRHDSHAAAAAGASAASASEQAAQGGEPAAEGQEGAGGGADVAAEPQGGADAAEASGEPGPPPPAASPGPSAPAPGPGLSPAGAAAAAVQGAARRVLHAVAAPAAALLGVGPGPGPAPASPATSGAFYFSVAAADGSGSAGASGTHAPADGAAVREPAAAAGPRLELTASLERVDCLEAAVAAGLEPAAAQTCLALLADPGGLYLDVKSAYSTPRDLELFVSALKGLGIHTKAVCSFQPCQLQVSPGLAHTVLFFHGLSGLENACDAKRVAPGQFVLFNGASFLADLSPGGLQLPEDRAAELLGSCRQFPVDALVLRRYKGLVEQYGFAGGIYVQEPDTSASAAQALIGLVSANEAYFPLGFAYGHLRDAAVSVLELGGRGFASQEILEELASRGELSAKVVSRINAGEHRGVSANVAATWAGRLVSSSRLLSLREQRALIALLAELPPGEGLLAVLDDLGGIPRIVLRFFQHYEHWTPMTLLEAGFNLNRQKAFLRLLRNHGALAALPLHRKVELARFFVGPQLRGYGLTYLLQLTRLRLGLHKHAKEGLLCLLESCTRRELEGVLLALGGRARVVRKLRGRLRLSWHYAGRLAAVEGLHGELPQALAYEQTGLKYAALPGVLEELAAREKGVGEGGDAEGGAPPFNHLHTRRKSKRERLLKQARKLGCCAFSLGNCLALNLITIGLFTLCCLYPRALGATFKGTCPMPALVAFVLGMAVAVGLYIVLAGLIGDVAFL